jgi:hypothetical protein
VIECSVEIECSGQEWSLTKWSARSKEEQISVGAEVQWSRGAEEQRSRGAEEQRSKGAEEQWSRGAEKQRSKGAEEQKIRGAVQVFETVGDTHFHGLGECHRGTLLW